MSEVTGTERAPLGIRLMSALGKEPDWLAMTAEEKRGALLFFGCAWSLGSRHHVRDALISVTLSLVTFYGFYLGLGIHLPAGVLEGVL